MEINETLLSPEIEIPVISEDVINITNKTCPMCRREDSLYFIGALNENLKHTTGNAYECANCGSVIAALSSVYTGEDVNQELIDKGPVTIFFDSMEIDRLVQAAAEIKAQYDPE